MGYSAGRKAFICGLEGLAFNDAERDFFEKEKPWGLILFKRNCESPDQIKALVAEFRALAQSEEAPVFIDQEGGRVQRLRPPHWLNYPSAAQLVASSSPERAIYIVNRLIADDLSALGISSNCGPVADLGLPVTHDVIGDRAYGETPEDVSRFAMSAMHGLEDGGLYPVIKHIPGHGRATSDSHLELPVVTETFDKLNRTDFECFKSLAAAPMAMTAHILYSDLDPDQPATLSRHVIDSVIRGTIGFYNLLMSDDISMKALKGDIDALSSKALKAGCDLVLHCNGTMEEMQAVASACPVLSAGSLQRAEKALQNRKNPTAIDRQRLLEELHRYLPEGSLTS